MSASLVGSEMCIRDRGPGRLWRAPEGSGGFRRAPESSRELRGAPERSGDCLLYTSDAADDM
eukprot:9001664-Alexandrium_andersonii.AAC.1